jgi:hypothetical protein
MKRFLKLIALALALAALPVLALADTGSAAVTDGQTYTLEQMLTYALEDEYMAEAEYAAIQAAFGVNNPYANIQNAEVTHQEALLRLFAAYGIPVPANTAAGSVVIPATLQETYEIGVQAEISNIAMYRAFLAQDNVPQDFTELTNASQSHLNAFSRNLEKTGTGYGNGNRSASPQDGTGYNAKGAADECDSCAASSSQQSRGGRNRR